MTPPTPWGAPGALVETGSVPPRGSSLPACSWSVFAAGWWVCTYFLCKSWKPEKKVNGSGSFPLSLQLSFFFCAQLSCSKKRGLIPLTGAVL